MVRCRGGTGPGLGPWPWGACGADSVCGVFQVRGVGLLPPGVASSRAAAASAYDRGKDCSPPAQEGMTGQWREPTACFAGMFAKGIQAFKELGVLSDVICVVVLSYERSGGAFT